MTLEELMFVAEISSLLSPNHNLGSTETDKQVTEVRLKIARELDALLTPTATVVPETPKPFFGSVSDTILLDMLEKHPSLISYRTSPDGRKWHACTVEETSTTFHSIPYYENLRCALKALRARLTKNT